MLSIPMSSLLFLLIMAQVKEKGKGPSTSKFAPEKIAY